MNKTIDLKPGVSIEFKNSVYTGSIPESVMKERCTVLKDGKTDEKESKKLFDSQVKKYKLEVEKDVNSNLSK